MRLLILVAFLLNGCADKQLKTSNCSAKYEFNCECDCAAEEGIQVITETLQ